MMRTRFGLVAVVAVVAIGTGVASAIALSGEVPVDDGQPGSLLAKGTTSKGEPYTISRMSDEIAKLGDSDATSLVRRSDVLCLEARANGATAAGCVAFPREGEIEPVQVTLGEDMIVYALAGEGVEGLKAGRVDGKAASATAPEPVSVGSSSRLFHVALPTPADTLPTDQGIPLPPAVDVTAVDVVGKTLDTQTLDVSIRR